MSPAAAITMRTREFPALEHYDYYDLDRYCVCPLCVEWRERLAALQLAQDAVTKKAKHCEVAGCFRDMKGPCPECRAGMFSRTAFHASNNRRDLYSECSWHASAMDSAFVGERFMEWLARIMANRTVYRDSWWVGKAPHLSLQYWLTMFHLSVEREVVMENRLIVDLGRMPHSANRAAEFVVAAASGLA